MDAPRSCRLVTLGCKVNQYETQYVKEMLEAAGWAEAADGRPADLCVVNTCTVTHEGDAKSRQTVRRLAVIGFAVAVDLERFLDVLRLVLVDLATEGDESAGRVGGRHDETSCRLRLSVRAAPRER